MRVVIQTCYAEIRGVNYEELTSARWKWESTSSRKGSSAEEGGVRAEPAGVGAVDGAKAANWRGAAAGAERPLRD